jgi:hypothetical protein
MVEAFSRSGFIGIVETDIFKMFHGMRSGGAIQRIDAGGDTRNAGKEKSAVSTDRQISRQGKDSGRRA